MSEWAELEALDTEIKLNSATKTRSRRTSRATTNTATETAADKENGTDRVNDAAAVHSSTPAATTTHQNAPQLDGVQKQQHASAVTAASGAVAATVPLDELSTLRLENARLRAALHSAGPSAATHAPGPSASAPGSRSGGRSRMLERSKARVAFDGVSDRVRRHLDTMLVQAEMRPRPTRAHRPPRARRSDATSSSSDDSDDEESELVGGGGMCAAGTVHYFESFCVDRLGIRHLPGGLYQPLDAGLFDVPQYEGPVNVIPLPLAVGPAGQPDPFAMLNSCFNCGLQHQMRECTQAREENCIRVNTMLYREYAQGRSKADGSLMAGGAQGGRGGGGGGGGGGGTHYQGRFFTEESLKTEVAAVLGAEAEAEAETDGNAAEDDDKKAKADEHEEGEIVLEEGEMESEQHDQPSPAKAEAGAPAPAQEAAPASGEYFMHAVHSLKQRASGALAEDALPRSELQVIDSEDEELLVEADEADQAEAHRAAEELAQKKQREAMAAAARAVAEQRERNERAREKQRLEQEEHGQCSRPHFIPFARCALLLTTVRRTLLTIIILSYLILVFQWLSALVWKSRRGRSARLRPPHPAPRATRACAPCSPPPRRRCRPRRRRRTPPRVQWLRARVQRRLRLRLRCPTLRPHRRGPRSPRSLPPPFRCRRRSRPRPMLRLHRPPTTRPRTPTSSNMHRRRSSRSILLRTRMALAPIGPSRRRRRRRAILPARRRRPARTTSNSNIPMRTTRSRRLRRRHRRRIRIRPRRLSSSSSSRISMRRRRRRAPRPAISTAIQHKLLLHRRHRRMRRTGMRRSTAMPSPTRSNSSSRTISRRPRRHSSSRNRRPCSPRCRALLFLLLTHNIPRADDHEPHVHDHAMPLPWPIAIGAISPSVSITFSFFFQISPRSSRDTAAAAREFEGLQTLIVALFLLRETENSIRQRTEGKKADRKVRQASLVDGRPKDRTRMRTAV